MDRSFASRRDARYAALLFCAAGALAIVNAWTPGVCPPHLRPAFTGLGLLDLAVGATLVRLPWERWPRRALLAIAAVALIIVDLFAILGRLEPWIYSVFFVVLAVWVGLSLPRWSTAWLAPALAAAYVLPILLDGREDRALAAVGLVVPVVVLIGETIASAVAGLREASIRDELTGVGNRRHGMAALERVRPGDAVFVLDLDRFKDINDRHGHAGGDAVLVALGTLLQTRMRGADTVARLGGEEFLVVASQAKVAAEVLGQRLVEDWRRTRPRTTISVGATVHQRGESPTESLARADRALYVGRMASCWRTSPARARTTGTAAAGTSRRQHRDADPSDQRAPGLRRTPHSSRRPVRRQLRRGGPETCASRKRTPARGSHPLASVDAYDTILLGSPLWNVRAPMIMSTFAERYDFSGKTVHPVTTHAMSGLGRTPEDYARVCRGARIATGLAVRGEQARSAATPVDEWLREAGLLDG